MKSYRSPSAVFVPPSFKVVCNLLATLPEEYESKAHEVWRKAEGKARRWEKRDWQAISYALTRLEDLIELDSPRMDRVPLKNLRRSFEDAVDFAERA